MKNPLICSVRIGNGIKTGRREEDGKFLSLRVRNIDNSEDMKVKIRFALLLLLALTGCVKEKLDPCPVGKVKVNIYAEKFQNPSDNPGDQTEERVADRLGHLRYFLYQEGSLKDKGVIRDFSGINDAFYTLNWDALDFGNYQLVLVGNSTRDALSGDETLPDNLVLTYPGCDLTEDFFAAVLPFEVNCNCTSEFRVALSRVQGVVRYSFKGVPADLTDVEIGVTHVSNQKYITGEYTGEGEAVKKYAFLPVKVNAESNPRFAIGIFPTLPEKRAVFSMKLYRNHEDSPYYNERISDTLKIRRNQLLDIITTFSDGKVQFDIRMDGTWDGTSSGGDIDIHSLIK